MSESSKGWVAPHSHCQYCGKSVPVNKPFCSKKCAEQVYEHEKKGQRSSRLYLVAIFITIITLLLWVYL